MAGQVVRERGAAGPGPAKHWQPAGPSHTGSARHHDLDQCLSLRVRRRGRTQSDSAWSLTEGGNSDLSESRFSPSRPGRA